MIGSPGPNGTYERVQLGSCRVPLSRVDHYVPWERTTFPTWVIQSARLFAAVVLAVLLAPLLCQLLLASNLASAHGTPPGVMVVVDALTPRVPGMTVKTGVALTEQMSLTVSVGAQVTVLDDSDQEFLRIGPGGVAANVSSPTWYRVTSALHDATIPPTAGPNSPPQWLAVSRQPTWTWFDPRLHDATPQAQLEHKSRGSSFGFWIVPVIVNGRLVAISGHHVWWPTLA